MQIVSEIEEYIRQAITQWSGSHAPSGLFKRSTTTLKEVFSHLITHQDSLVTMTEGVYDKGPDRKAVVLYALLQIFKVAVRSLSPIWLKPIQKPLEYLLINVVCGYLIDFTVAKYNEGVWQKASIQKFPNEFGLLTEGSSGNG